MNRVYIAMLGLSIGFVYNNDIISLTKQRL